ncbi:hypothetical protein ONZ45_g1075 [Pleurotus djamor]|nr:hypothetical protein ONZ45_g1075 [Pleurotus djamor]
MTLHPYPQSSSATCQLSALQIVSRRHIKEVTQVTQAVVVLDKGTEKLDSSSQPVPNLGHSFLLIIHSCFAVAGHLRLQVIRSQAYQPCLRHYAPLVVVGVADASSPSITIVQSSVPELRALQGRLRMGNQFRHDEWIKAHDRHLFPTNLSIPTVRVHHGRFNADGNHDLTDPQSVDTCTDTDVMEMPSKSSAFE